MKICLIPARGGSKRIRNKNIKNFCGKPLISYSIDLAKKSKIFDEIYVTTDSQKIKKISIKYGAKVPFLRPKKISNDRATDKEVLDHFIEYCKKKNINIDYLCYLYPTSPLLDISTLKKCNKMITRSNYFQLMTVCSFPSAPQKAMKKNKFNEVELINKKFQFTLSQNLKELYYDAGQCYWYNLKKTKLKNKILSIKLNRYNVQDINTMEDFVVAEQLYKLKLARKKK